MGQKLDFNIEDSGLKIDGTAAIGSDASYSGTLNSDKITGGTISASRLPYTHNTDSAIKYQWNKQWSYMVCIFELIRHGIIHQ